MSIDAETRRILKDLIDARRRAKVIANQPPPVYRSKPGPKVELPQVGTQSSGGVRTAQHGTERVYKRYGCKCVECRDAARLARNIRRDRAERRCGFCGERRCFEHRDLEECA